MEEKDYEQLATKIMMNALEGVKAQIRKAYNKGYKDGKADTPFTDTEEAEDKAYNKGLADMLEAFKSMRMMTADDLQEVFGLRFIGDIFVNLSPSKIISKYHAFMAQIKELEDAEIKVGDEVILNANASYENEKAIVLAYDGNAYPYNVLMNNGDTEWIKEDAIECKTGRYFPQIAEVLKEMRGAENDE